MGVCIEPPPYVVGLQEFEQYIQRDRPEGVRSQPGDLDLTVYSLRKWVRLALKGNPSILLLLFVPAEALVQITPEGYALRDLAWAFASRRAAEPFLGFIRQQKERLLGERGQLRVNRPELVEAHGYDTKYAGHILRLAHQGVEYLTTGRLTLPMPEDARQEVLSVRRGEWSMQQALTRAGELERELSDLRTTSPLPSEPDASAVERWMIGAYLNHWQATA